MDEMMKRFKVDLEKMMDGWYDDLEQLIDGMLFDLSFVEGDIEENYIILEDMMFEVLHERFGDIL